MAQLTFATEGQAAALAAQESVRKKALEIKQEFEAGAKMAGSWDAATAKMARTSEAALRSVHTEQEKIATQITDIQKAVENGLYDGREEEATIAMERLREKWVEVDEATVLAKNKTLDYQRQQDQLKTAAVSAMESVKTELEEVKGQIEAVEQASKDKLIDDEQAQQAIGRLQNKLKDLETDTKGIGGRIEDELLKAFDPVKILKVGVSFIGVQAAINQLKQYVEDAMKRIDKRAETQEKLGKEAEAKIVRFASTFGMGLPVTFMPTAQDVSDAARYGRNRTFSDIQEKAYEDLARMGEDNPLTTKQSEQMGDVLRELGVGGLSQTLLGLQYQMPYGRGGTAITREEAVEMYEGAARVSSGLVTTGQEPIGQLIQILQQQGSEDARFRAEQLSKLDQMIDALRDGGLMVIGQ